jgi:hypothetical protein
MDRHGEKTQIHLLSPTILLCTEPCVIGRIMPWSKV